MNIVINESFGYSKKSYCGLFGNWYHALMHSTRYERGFAFNTHSALSASITTRSFGIICVFLLAGVGFTKAEDFKGASEVLREAAQAIPKSKEQSKDPSAPFREKLKSFQTSGTNLPPDQAAAECSSQ